VTVVGVVLVSGDPVESARLDGRTLIDHAVSALRGSGVVDVVSVLSPPLPPAAAPSVSAAPSPSGGSFVDGVEVVVLHDPHRPLAPASLVAAVVAAVRAGADAAVPVVEVTETVKEVDPGGRIVRTVPRDQLVQLQYPRAVRPWALRPDGSVVPDARTVTVPGAADAFQVRDELDLELAAAVLAARA
jgi:2-C-methyl-D-erythritol 4-phosphate cytidylyltransferase